MTDMIRIRRGFFGAATAALVCCVRTRVGRAEPRGNFYCFNPFSPFFGALLLMAVGHYQQNLKTILKTDSLSIELCKKYITKRPN